MSSAVYSPTCLKRGFVSFGGIISCCARCYALLRLKTFCNALYHTPCEVPNAKFTPKSYRNPLMGEAFLRHQDVYHLFMMGEKRWLEFAKRLASGHYKDMSVLVGLVEAMMLTEEREFRGVGMQNMKYSEDFDRFCTILAAISPAAYRTFRITFTGRTLKSMGAIHASHPRYAAGIEDINFDQLVLFIKAVGWMGKPIGLCVDDTKSHPGLRPYHDGVDNKWKLAGVHGRVPTFETYNELTLLLAQEQNNKAEKARVWLVIIPMSNIPPFAVAIMAIKSTSTAQEIRAWHDAVESKLQQRGVHHISYTPDGASMERRLEHKLLSEATESGNVRTWSFSSPIPGSISPFTISVPLLPESGKPRVLGTDGKHGKKNRWGSVHSGAHTLVLGNYIAHFSQLKEIAESETSPLLQADIIGVDKQDDCAAAHLFSSAVIDHLQMQTPKDSKLGLAIYLFIIGDLIDSQQSRSISFHVWMKILWRSRIFLDRWFQSIKDHPHYSPKTHFISCELYDIFNLFIESMLGLILIHRDYYPQTLLLPWLHSTECCEHFFRCARRVIKDFTFLDLIYMMPKLTLLVDQDIHSQGRANAKASAHHSGYHHSWYDLTDIKYQVLSQFPSDDEIVSTVLPHAYDEAEQLLQLLSIPMSNHSLTGSHHDIHQGFVDAASKFIEDLHSGSIILDEFNTDPTSDGFVGESDIIEDLDPTSIGDILDPNHDPEVVDHQDGTGVANEELKSLLHDSSQDELMDHCSETAVRNCGVATAATVLHDSHAIDALPEAGETAVLKWQESILHCLSAVEAHMTPEQKAQYDIDVAARQTSEETNHCMAPTKLKKLPIRLVEDGQLNYVVLMAERLAHETAEARASVAWRYRKTLSISDTLSTPTASLSSAGTSSRVPEDTGKLRMKLVNEIVRIQQAYEESRKRSGSGLEQKQRWLGTAASGSTLRMSGSYLSDVFAVSQTDLKGKQKAFAAIEEHLLPSWPLAKAGIDAQKPLKPGSGVLVVHQNEVFYGLVVVLFERGGGKTPTHNFVDRCIAID
ncbi:hypothetical protein QCA50_010858 [Cerrena zonata]|uniref:Uncharacterized protein n=1 Tax=Cerrena zonata TaxID=2478898 RepID=A0AAW0FYK4_9APHY